MSGPTPSAWRVPLPQFPYLIGLDSGRRPHGSLEDSGISECEALRTGVFFFIGSE